MSFLVTCSAQWHVVDVPASMKTQLDGVTRSKPLKGSSLLGNKQHLLSLNVTASIVFIKRENSKENNEIFLKSATAKLSVKHNDSLIQNYNLTVNHTGRCT